MPDSDESSRFRRISCRIWNDRKFVERLTDDGRLVWLLILTHKHLTMLGVYVGGPAHMADEYPGHWSVDRMRAAFGELVDAGMLVADDRGRAYWLRNFLRHNRPSNPNQVRAWRKVHAWLPECDVTDQALAEAERVAVDLGGAFTAAFYQVFPDRSPNRSPNRSGNGSGNRSPNGSGNTSSDRSRKASPNGSPILRSEDLRSEDLKQTDLPSVCVDHTTRARTSTEPLTGKPTEQLTHTHTQTQARPSNVTPIHQDPGALPTRRRQAHCAHEARRAGLSVPEHLHAELLSRMATPDDAALRAFYVRTEQDYDGQAIGEDVHKFWRRAFEAWQGTSTPRQDTPEVIAARINAKRAARGEL